MDVLIKLAMCRGSIRFVNTQNNDKMFYYADDLLKLGQVD